MLFYVKTGAKIFIRKSALTFNSYRFNIIPRASKNMGKIGLIITEDSDGWGGESGVGQFFLDRFNKANKDESITFEVIKAVTGNLPQPDEICNFTGFVISGSHYSVNDDFQWIRNLENFIVNVTKIREDKRPRIFGICYGHQIIAKALGGVISQNYHKKFIFGSTTVELDNQVKSKSYFKDIFGEGVSTVNIMQSHGEEVSTIPKEAVVVGNSETCKTEILQYGDFMMTTQGHPEFTEDKMTSIILPRLLKNSQLNSEEAEKSKLSMKIADTDCLVRFVMSYLTN